MIVNGTTLYSSGTYVSSLSWLYVWRSSFFNFYNITINDVGTHSFEVWLTFKDDFTFINVFNYSFKVIIAECLATYSTVDSKKVSATSYTIYDPSLTITLAFDSWWYYSDVTSTDSITYSSTLSGIYKSADSLTWIKFYGFNYLFISSNDLLLAGTTVFLKIKNI